MYEADSYVLLTYDRAASKAASRSRSRASPASQPLTIPPTTAPPPKPAVLTPVALPVAAPAETLAPSPSVKRAPVPKTKTKPRPKVKPVPVKPPTPPPPAVSGEAEDGEVEFEPVAVPEQTGLAMDLDAEQIQPEGGNTINNSETADSDADGILPWHAVPTTTHWKSGGTTSAFNTADEPEEEVFHFGGSLTKEQPRKAQSKPGRSGGIVFPKAGRNRDPPPRAPPPPPVQPPEPDDEEMEEVVLPGMESHSGDLEDEMMKQLQGESSDEDDDDEDGSDDDDEDGDDGFDVQAFEQALAQGMTEGDEGKWTDI